MRAIATWLPRTPFSWGFMGGYYKSSTLITDQSTALKAMVPEAVVQAPSPGKVTVKAVIQGVLCLSDLSPSLKVFAPAEKPPKQTQQPVALLSGLSLLLTAV